MPNARQLLESLAKTREPRRRSLPARRYSFGVGSNVSTSDEPASSRAAARAPLEDRAMTDVQAVEYADGHGARPGRRRGRGSEANVR